jgi:fructuronate reductase
MDGSQNCRSACSAHPRAAQDGAPIERLALGVAAWMRYVVGRDEQGRAIDLATPLADRLARIAGEAGPVRRRLAPALARLREVFGDDLRPTPRFTGPVREALATLFPPGRRATVARRSAGLSAFRSAGFGRKLLYAARARPPRSAACRNP